ncbi:MAG TPA: DUF1572 family protein [Cyclobacteriaceae bacterium]|nr:DUF1572 family protein [Cyclobacteriaceae bacterium]
MSSPIDIHGNFLESSGKLFRYYKLLGEKAIDQLNDDQINARPNPASNSISLIVHHLSGNMLSRFTDFLTADGEKAWRNRDAEFTEGYANKAELLAAWEKGWACLFAAIDSLQPADLSRIIYIRNEGQTVLEAIQRQLAHYPHHVGQILYQAKALVGDGFQTLSIARGTSDQFNTDKFSRDKTRKHFTDDMN